VYHQGKGKESTPEDERGRRVKDWDERKGIFKLRGRKSDRFRRAQKVLRDLL